MHLLLVHPNTKLRSVDEVCEKARAILANVKELREAARGDEGVFKEGIDLLDKLEGKSLPPGWFVRYSKDVVDAVGRDFEDTVRANPDAYSPQ